MKINMNDSRLVNIRQLKDFLKGAQPVKLSLENAPIEERYKFIDDTVDRFGYINLGKKEKGVVLDYLKKVTGYEEAQLYRLVKRARIGDLKRKEYKRENPNRKYGARDIKLLEETDSLHLKLNSVATKEILRREYEKFGNEKYKNIAEVSSSHINNLRKSMIYKNSYVNPTNPRKLPIGTTEKPKNYGCPGSIKSDVVDQDGVKHVNSVDEITQWEVVVCVPRITQRFMIPAYEMIIASYPFPIFNFHTDKGSESINYKVADLLSREHIKQTKCRARHPNDNALVETKNGSVIRKNMGWHHLDQGVSDLINDYYIKYFNNYLNYHRPCLFPTKVYVNDKGYERKIYGEAMIPYEKLKEVSKAKGKNFLKKGFDFEYFDKIAYEYSDNEYAKIVREEEAKLFEKIQKLKK